VISPGGFAGACACLHQAQHGLDVGQSRAAKLQAELVQDQAAGDLGRLGRKLVEGQVGDPLGLASRPAISRRRPTTLPGMALLDMTQAARSRSVTCSS
jgi:hypothetical protein